MNRFFATLAAAALCLACGVATAQTPAPLRLHGTVEQADATGVTLKARSGETIQPERAMTNATVADLVRASDGLVPPM